MNQELSETKEKLEKIEANALEDTNEVSPLEQQGEVVDATDNTFEQNIELSTCTCSGGCGSNYSYGTCMCSGSCGSSYHK